MGSKRTFVIIFLSLTAVALLLANLIPFIEGRRHFSGAPVVPRLSAPGAISARLQEFSTTNASRLAEIEAIQPLGSGVVVALSESPRPDVLQVVYGQGTFLQWHLVQQRVVASKTLFAVETSEDNPTVLPALTMLNAGVTFSTDGSRLMTPATITVTGLDLQTLWKTEGMIQVTRGNRIQSHQFLIHPVIDVDFFLSDIIIRGEFGFVENQVVGVSPLLEAEHYGLSILSRMAIDPIGDYFAVVDENGKLLLTDVSAMKEYGPDEAFFPQYQAYFRLVGKPDQNVNTLDLELDSSHSWLAHLTDKNLVVWSLRNYFFPEHLNVDLMGGNTVSFDRLGKLLAVATGDGILVFDLEAKKEIASYKVGNVTALYFSHDNRMLIWGDAQGTVHLWGVK